MKRNEILFIVFVLFIPATFVACKKNNDKVEEPKKSSYVRIVHIAPKAPEVQVEVDKKIIPVKARYLDMGWGYAPLRHNGEVQLKLLTNGRVVLAEGKLSLTDKQYYTFFIHDTIKDNKAKYTILNDNLPAAEAGKIGIRFLHFAPDAPPVDIDLLKGRDSLRLVNGRTYIGKTTRPDTLAPFTKIAAGTYRIKVKIKEGSTIKTIVDMPSVALTEKKTATLCLSGLMKDPANKPGLVVLEHKP